MESFYLHTYRDFLQACTQRWTKMLLYIKNVPLINFSELKATRPQGHKGSFNNYVDIDLPLFDHHVMWTFFTLIVDQNGPFMDHLHTSSCPRTQLLDSSQQSRVTSLEQLSVDEFKKVLSIWFDLVLKVKYSTKSIFYVKNQPIFYDFFFIEE